MKCLISAEVELVLEALSVTAYMLETRVDRDSDRAKRMRQLAAKLAEPNNNSQAPQTMDEMHRLLD